METDFKELHFTATSVRKKVHSRGVQEKAMSQPSRKKSKTLEVQTMFEPNRLQQNYLHTAYSCLVPVLKRRLFTHRAALEVSSQALAQARERNMP